MVEKLAQNITNVFVEKGLVDGKKRDIYEYGFAHIITEAVSWALLFAIAIAVHKFTESLVYFFVFMILRHSAGGFHAKTRLGCQALFLGTYILFLILLYILPDKYYTYIIIPILLFCDVVMSIICPIDNENKRCSDKEKMKYKRKTILLLAVFTLSAAVILVFANNIGYIALCIALAMLNVCISDIAGMNQGKEVMHHEK